MIQEITAPQSVSAPVSREFECVEPDKVGVFLERHSFIGPLLAEIPPQLRPYFPLSLLRLRVIDDPEGVGPAELVLDVVTHLDAESARAALDAFDNNWWLDHYDRAQGLLIITLAFG